MRKTIITIIACISAFAAFFCSAQDINRYEVKLNDFTELKVNDAVNVIYRSNPDSAGIAVFNCQPALASSIMFSPQGAKLSIQLATNNDVAHMELPTVTVYSNFITKVENNGDSTVRVFSPKTGPKFKGRLVGNGRLIIRDIDANIVEGSIDTGNGTLVLSGHAPEVKLSNTGAGQLLADDLVADNIKCSLWGTGTVGCHARTLLTVTGAGTGTIYYLGTPEIKKKMALNIKCLPAN
ncbi:MAG: DUF2807 domain-containing protein [Paramuribaculum sp.]|nr:DUF2807 domain-containing protein [Paramuribaculum sp.]